MCDNPNAGRARTVTEPQNIDYQPETNEPCEAVQAQLHTIETWQQADELAESTRKTPPSLWQRQMLAQGPWDQANDPDFVGAFNRGPKSVKGASSFPVLVVNSDRESPEMSFSHLEGGKPDTSCP